MTVKISGNSSASTPSFAGDDGDSGLHATADQVQLVTNGTVGVTVDSSQNVGIGTTTPGTKLEVGGTITSKTSTAGLNDQSITFSESGSGANYGVRLGHVSNTEFAFERYDYGWAETVRIDGMGRVGIGSTSVPTKLTLGQDTDTDGSNVIRIYRGGSSGQYSEVSNTGSHTNLNTVGGGGITLNIGGSEKARIDSSGRLLVGTTASLNSGCLFQTAGDDTTRDWAIKYTGTSGGAETGIKFLDKNNAVNAQISNNLQNDGSGSQAAHLVFKTAHNGTLTERVRFEQRGIVYGYSEDAGVIQGLSNGAGTIFRFFSGRHSATGANGTGSESYRVWSNGNVQNTNNSYGSISDIKLKENIVDASSQWDDLKAIQVRKYNFKEETGNQTHTQLGVVAQEIELVSPGLVSESPDTDEAGNDLGTTTKSVNYSVLYMKAVKALQEAMDRIETLESVNAEQATTIASFEARISALEGGN